MANNKIVDMVPSDKENELTVNEILNEFKSISKISILKEEDNVIRSLIRGTSKRKILEELQTKYPEENITQWDLEQFLVLYKDVLMDQKQKLQTAYGRRLIKQQEGLTNELIDLALTTKRLVNKYDDEGDNTNTVGALRVAADIFMKVGKIEGLFNERPEVNVNMQMDRVVNNITSNDSEFKKSIMKVMESKKDVFEEKEEVIDVEDE